MSVVDIERAVVRVCFAPDAPEDDLLLLGDARVWRIYRDMVRKRLREECRRGLRRTLRAAGSEAFERAFVAHLADEQPRTRLFREIVTSFARSAAPRFRADATLPAYVADLCEWEAALWEVSDLDDRVEPAPGEFAFDKVAVIAPATRLLALGHAVHEKPSGEGGFPAREVYLCVHRRADERRASTWTLTPVMYAVMLRLAHGGDTVSDAIKHVALERGIAVDQCFLDGLCTVLADFLERGLLLGSR